MVPKPNRVLFGTERSRRFPVAGLAAGLCSLSLYALGVVDAGPGVGLLSGPAVLVGMAAACWVGYRRAGLLAGWGVTAAALLGYRAYGFGKLTGLTVAERLVGFLGVGGLTGLVVAAVVLGTLPCLVGYHLRWSADRGLPTRRALAGRVRSARAVRRGVEYLFAGGVLAIALLIATDSPTPYPAWPTVGAIPVDPELVVPGLLGVVILAGVSREEVSVGAVLVGTLAVLTVGMAGLSLHTLYTSQAGGVFFGGLFSLGLGVVLAVSTVTRDLVRFGIRHEVFAPSS